MTQAGKTATILGDGTWSISNVTAFQGDLVTIFIDGAIDTGEAVAVTIYDGIGNITGVQLARRNLTLGSVDNPILRNSDIAHFDNADDEDIFFTVSGSNLLTLCVESGCATSKLRILSGTTYQPDANSTVVNFANSGTFSPATNTIRVSGSWTQNGTFNTDASSVIFTATTSSLTLDTSSSTLTFNNLTLGETSGVATWSIGRTLAVLGSFVGSYGTLARGTSSIVIAQNLQFGAAGYVSGLGTTTFSGSGSHTWGDAKSATTSSNMGYVVVDGTAKTITLAGNVGAQSVIIGSDDTLNASGSGYNINVAAAWSNNNAFIAQTGTVTFIGTSTATINRGASAFNHLSFTGVGGNWSFSTTTLAVGGNFTIATGTVTLPTGTTTIAGSFNNTGGTFLHNNGEVRMTSLSGGRTLTQSGTAFLNSFYDLVFTGSGAWSFSEARATTTRNFRVTAGTVTFPSSTLTVGGDFLVTGTGAFTHNSGEVILLVLDTDEVRTNGASFNNVRTVGSGLPLLRTFADTTLTVLGNLIIDTGGDVVFPTGVLSIGGSFDNNATFNASVGTIRFNSIAGVETIAAGSSAFATLEFNSTGGDFTVTESATATVAINLTTATQFTLLSGVSLAAQGTFTNALTATSTTWTGSTLRFLNANTATLNSKTHAGDTYGTLAVASSTLVKMWNSSATTYSTQGTTSAIYSQDHAGVDGDLYMYGNYLRTTGTEYWSYATDFDGVALSASTSRQVDVRIATSSQIGFTGASLNMIGTAAASTTLDAQAGAYSLNATNTTITAENFRITGTDTAGFGLRASTTLSVFRDGHFTVNPSRSAITVDASTVDTNPTAQYYRVGFATSSPGTTTNVTLSGSPSSFIWFREGTGGLYGEAYDGADANPGAIRFDDSSNTIIVSGTVYNDAGATSLGGPTCDGVTNNVRVVVDGGSYASSTSCNAITGAYSFASMAYVGDPKVVVYLDTNGGVQGSVITKTPTSNITNMHIYANRVITRHQDVSALTLSDMQTYDFDNDSDLRFIAATTSLTVLPNTELFVFASSTLAPGGNITLSGNGNANSYEGTLQLGVGATFTATGTETHTLAGRFVLATTSTFIAASSTFIFNATTTGKSITSPNTVTFNQLQFNGQGGGWNITAPLIVQANMHIATGTVTGTGNLTLNNGSLYGNGMLSLGAGTTTINRTNTLGGISAWTFHHLVLGNGTVVGTTTSAGTATSTISGSLTIANAHFLQAGSANFDLAGSGTVFTKTGTFLEGTSTMRFSGAGSTVPAANYYNLRLDAGVGTATYTAAGAGSIIYNDLTIGGTANSTFNQNTNDPVVEVRGDVVINSTGTFEGSNSAALTMMSDWTNVGTFNGNSGTVTFAGSATTAIAAGNSSFSNVLISGTGAFSVTGNATTTASFLLTNHTSFTLASGTTLAVGGQFTNSLGGAATTWSSSTLALYGTGTYSINASTTNDIYYSLRAGNGTQIRLWNSSATNYSVGTTGSLYSQDHSGVNGSAYIWGQLIRASGADYWSYATDFDGSNLAGGSERAVHVYFASSSTATWAGANLFVLGSTSATTTLANQGAGTYALTIGTGATTEWNRVQIRDISSDGVVLTGVLAVTDFSRTDHLVAINNGSAITVGGTAINANPAKNFTNNFFAVSGGVTTPKNVTATGTAVTSWRFTNHSGNLAGEAYDSDPAGDPGYIVWDDSAALITIAGNVYSDEGSTVSTVCNGVTTNIRLVVAGLTTYNASCNAVTGAYSIPNVAFSPLDTLTLYINGETPKAVNVSVAPISSISNMNLYHDRVIVRHENTDPLTIANMAVWDSSDDADIIFTAVDAGSDTLALPANAKLLIWTGKTFEPNGNVTLAGGGAGNPWDGTLEAQANARFRAKTTEVHSVGGSVTFGIGADFVTASSTLTLTTSGASRTFDVNASTLHNLTMSGSGSYSMTDAILTTTGSYTQSAGSVTFPTGTTTIGAAFNVTGGSFTHAGSGIVFTSNGAGNTVRFNNSVVPALTFSGSGSWSMTDVNATSTGAVMISAGAVTLPTGNLAVGGSFVKRAGTLTHNTSDIIMTATSSALLTASSSDLYAVHFAGPATFTITDTNITFLDSFTVASGSVAMASGTTAVGGSLTATGGVFTHATGTVLLNATSSGRTINPGSNTFFNLQLGAPTGGYTLSSATTTNNLTIASVSSLLVNPTATIAVGGVFTNSVGGAATTWSNTTLRLFSQNEYTINSKSVNGDVYGTLTISPNTDIRAWYSSAATTTIASSSSLYSQDHGNTNGELYIYGDYVIATTTEYWSYATDFDGAVLTGLNQRQAKVYFATNATTTVMSGSLHIVGASSTKSQIQNQTTGTYSLAVNGGTINANYYEFSDLNNRGLVLSGLATITNLANGYFDLAVATGTLISLSSTTLNANPSKIFDNVGFTATTGLSGYNVTLTGETSNAWRFTNHYGTLAGEAYDVDGIDACGSVRFADSACLLTEQTHIRWRNDNGGEGAPNSEWFNSSFDYRTRVRVLNNDNDAYASTAIKVAVPYQSVMQSDFDDIRFTSADGLTVIPFWIEKYTASTDAQIWVRLPSLPASNYATVFMYFGSSTAASLSNGDLTFDAFDDYEDNSISEYSGDTSLFNAATSPVYGGIYSLKPTNASGKTTDGIFRFDDTVSQGKIIRYMQYVNTTAGSGDEPCTLFGVQSPGTTNSNYGVCLEQFGTDRIALARDIDNNDTSGVVLATSTVTYATGWYEVEIDWRTNNTIFVSLFNSAGTRVASTTATDSTYTSGGYGYAFWFQNGAWDSFTARNRVATKPTVYLGAVQTDGGATWLGALDTIAMAVPGNTVRLRVAIENSGLDVTEQLYRLEYAAKGVAPTCESVSNGSYATVLNQVSCGMSPICMQTSTYVSNGAPTTDLLSDTSGTFRSGEIVTSPSTQTNSFALNQNYYSELEYVLTPTLQASDALCLRVTNNGTPLDFYNKVAELGLKFNPMLSLVTLNNGLNITLTPGTTTEVTITATTTDYNGYADLTHATTTLYRSVAGPACLANNNDCYSLSTENGRCSFTGCSGNSCRLTCQANVAFHADPTDFGSYEGQEWLAYTEIEDAAGGYDFDSAPGVELSTLRALQVNSLINYGTLQANSNTGSFNPTTTVANLGNTPINVDVVGSDLTDGGSSAIPAERQKMSTSSFAYGACVSCYQLSSSSAVTLNINLTKPIVANPPVQTSVYWGIEVPLGINSTPHSGTNIFTAKGV